MNKIVKELKDVLDKRCISPETAGHLIGCSGTTVYRWLKGGSPPSRTSHRKIKKAIEGLRETFEGPKSWTYIQMIQAYCPDLELSEKQKAYYEEILSSIKIQHIIATFFKTGIKPEEVHVLMAETVKELENNPVWKLNRQTRERGK